MSATLFDKVDRLRFDLQRINRDYRALSKNVGIGERDDVALRRKLALARERFNNTCNKIEIVMKQDRDSCLSAASTIGGDTVSAAASSVEKTNEMWHELRHNIGKEKTEFEKLDREVRAREKACPVMMSAGSGGFVAPHSGDGDEAVQISSGAGDDEGSVTAMKRRMQQQGFRQIDVSELNTEENIQREKLAAVVQIEQDVNEVKSMFQEFDEHLNRQQIGINNIEKNVDNSVIKVEKGVQELKEANKLQKSGICHKWCIIAVLLLGAGGAVAAMFVLSS